MQGTRSSAVLALHAGSHPGHKRGVRCWEFPLPIFWYNTTMSAELPTWVYFWPGLIKYVRGCEYWMWLSVWKAMHKSHNLFIYFSFDCWLIHESPPAVNLIIDECHWERLHQRLSGHIAEAECYCFLRCCFYKALYRLCELQAITASWVLARNHFRILNV